MHLPPGTGSASYAAAGVDVDAGERAVEALRPYAEKAGRPEVLGGIGGFAGLFAPRLGRYREPVLAASTDGVGTKVAIAQAVDKHDTIGLDLVAMVVDDLVVCGAEPLFLQDYIAVGKVVPEQVATIVSGIAEGCRQAGCALLGGETAEHPGLMSHGSYDLSTRTTSCAPNGCAPATCSSRCRRPACTRTATRWPGTCCSRSGGCRCTATSRSSATPSARSC
jgi:phosphoribosylaminoimidazole synthetase